MKTAPRAYETGMTLTEILVAVLLFATFCGSIFELNAVCLRYTYLVLLLLL